MRLLFCLIVALALAAPTRAAEQEPPHPIDAKMGKCMEADPSTAGLIGCAASAETAWDGELNQAYKALVAALKGKAVESLKQSQRAWVAHRDKEFALQGELRGQLSGTMWGPVMADQSAPRYH